MSHEMCIFVDDYSFFRFIIQLAHDMDVPNDLWVRNADGLGCIANIEVIRVWPSADSFDALYPLLHRPHHRLRLGPPPPT